MGKEKETRYMELDVPTEALTEVAEIIEEKELEATLLGKGSDEESITIGFGYDTNQRDSMMEILELIEDYKSGEEEQEEED